MDRGRCSTRNVPRQRSLLQRDWPGLRLHVPARLAHKSSISSQISFLLFKEGLEPRSKLEQQRKQVFKADLEPLRYTRPLNHSICFHLLNESRYLCTKKHPILQDNIYTPSWKIHHLLGMGRILRGFFQPAHLSLPIFQQKELMTLVGKNARHSLYTTVDGRSPKQPPGMYKTL